MNNKNSDYLKELQETIECLHKCKSSYFETASVVERFGLETVWSGQVHSFRIRGHPKANLCYAWTSPIKRGEKIKHYTVLCIPPIDSPEKAVRAAIINDQKQKTICQG